MSISPNDGRNVCEFFLAQLVHSTNADRQPLSPRGTAKTICGSPRARKQLSRFECEHS